MKVFAVSRKVLFAIARKVKSGAMSLDQGVAELQAQSGLNDMAALEAKTIILFAIGIIVLAAVIPSAMTAIHGANTTGWTAAETGIWGVMGIIVIGVAIYKLIE